MDAADLDRLADLLARHRRAPTPIEALPAALRPVDLAEGYAAQDAAVARLAAAGDGPVVGWKIGSTAASMQKYLGIPEPAAGRVLARDCHAGPATLARGGFLHPGAECEIAVRLGRDLGPGDAPVTAAEAAAAVAAAVPAIEIVDARFADFRAVDVASLVADGFFHAALVLGPERPMPPGGLADLEGTMTVDGREVGRGLGAEVMGDPINALAWLANHLAVRGETLAAGQVVTLGSIVPPHWLDGPARIEVEIAGLGSVAATVA
ncbi:MAG: hydratase [Alphaproteobacteria bacterium]|jgi:2-keto-4-pentenoate hydratase|nr:hydratase [Alphaproteobacteria bacterium]